MSLGNGDCVMRTLEFGENVDVDSYCRRRLEYQRGRREELVQRLERNPSRVGVKA